MELPEGMIGGYPFIGCRLEIIDSRNGVRFQGDLANADASRRSITLVNRKS